MVLAFPCNQFGGQEPGDADEIRAFVDKYGVTFPMFQKVDINGPNTFPLYKHLKEKKGGWRRLPARGLLARMAFLRVCGCCLYLCVIPS